MTAKAQAKSPALIEAEKRETEELIKKIISATNGVPEKVRNGASHQVATAFKATAIAARKAAESKAPRLAKLRDAWVSISPYYAQQ